MFFSVLLAIFCIGSTSSLPLDADLFKLPVVHVNDFHARFDETSLSSGTCKNEAECIGGFSRFYAEIEKLLAEQPGAILLNGGDNFQGTLYYTLGKWNITQEFMNKLPFDAIVLGNHEFDDSVAGVVPFIKSLKAPVVCANIDDSQEPDIQGTYTKSVVVERNGRKIGIIGVIYSKTDEIANSGKLRFYPESEIVNAEADRLVREEGVFTNIVLSHVGYDIDKEIAQNATEKIGLIVGAHSHTFLYTGDNPQGPDTPAGPYPTIIKSKNGKDILIVQASAYTKYLGNITVFYGSDGEIADYSGAPIFLGNDLPKDEEINTALMPWKNLVEAEGSIVLGSTLVKLTNNGCYYKECTLGNFVTDAYVFSYTQNGPSSWTKAAIAFENAGGLRSDIEIGDITYNDMLTAQPFGNTVDVGELEGKYIKAALERAAGQQNNGRVSSSTKLLQVSGLHVVYNLTKPLGNRVQDVKVRCQNCTIPIYENLDLNATYKIIVPSFLSGGGDGFTAISDNIKNLVTGQIDMDVFRNYLSHRSPIFEEEGGRITVFSPKKLRCTGWDL